MKTHNGRYPRISAWLWNIRCSLLPTQPRNTSALHNRQSQHHCDMEKPESDSFAETLVIFTCTICADEDCMELNPRMINNNYVCYGCIKDGIVPLFHKALKYEFAYPVAWDAETLLWPDDFAEELGPEFIKRFKQVEKEYQTPPKDRVYCKSLLLKENVLERGQKTYGRGRVTSRAEEERLREERIKLVECGGFVGTRKPFDNWSIFIQPYCHSCSGRVCSCCGNPIYAGEVKYHDCQWREDTLEETFVGPEMKRGEDYQVCPGPECGTIVGLRDGCNFIRCAQVSCLTGFCFVCGEGPLEDASSHWRSGKPCPRYNQPGQRNAV